MPTVADLRVKFSADTKDAERGIRNIDKSIKDVANNKGFNLGDMFNVAGGNLIAGTIRDIGSALVNIGGQAFGAYADVERLSMSLETFAARELINAGVTDNMSEAIAMSGERAQEMLGWIRQLATESPFNATDIASAFRLAQAYGFTSTEAQRLTQATVDYAAGAGISGAMMDRITLALGQIAARGKLSAGEINQLSEAGINVRQILSNAFGVSTAEIIRMTENGLIPADRAIEAITQSLEKDFGGAAKRQSSTFSGLLSSLEDLRDFSMTDFIEGTAKAVQPVLTDIVDMLKDPAVTESIKAWGDSFGQWVAGGIRNATDALAIFNQAATFAPDFSAAAAGIGSLLGADVTVDATAKIVDVDWLSGAFTHHYDATAGIEVTSVLWGAWESSYNSTAQISVTSILWGAWKTSYDAIGKISVTDILWGGWKSVYNATAQIGVTSILWGAWKNQYSATAGISVTNILWGGWKSEYDATANISVTDAGWGAWTHTYDATAKIPSVDSILWGAFTVERDITGKLVGFYIGDGVETPTVDVAGNITSVTPTTTPITVPVIPGMPSGADLKAQWDLLWQGFTVTPLFSFTPIEWSDVFGFGQHETLDFGITKINWVDVFDFELTWNPSVPARLTWENVFDFSLDWIPKITWPNVPPAIQALIDFFSGGGTADAAVQTEKLSIKLAPDAIETLNNFAPTIEPPSAEAMAPLLAMQAPTLPANFWPDYNTWTWPDYLAFTWPNYNAWAWPDYLTFTWPNYNTWTWPSIPMPGWVNTLVNWRPSLPSWMGGANDSAGYTSSGTIGGNASGTDYWHGGLTWVGEKGPELVALPRGSAIYSNQRSMAMAGAGGQTVNVYATVANGIDIHQVAYQVADIMRRRGR